MTGATSNLLRRIEQRLTSRAGFTWHYNLDTLIHVERHDTITAAIQREKNIEHWSRPGRSG